MTDDRKLRDDLLLATLPHVTFDGWTRRALRAGAAELDLDPMEAEAVFPGGMVGMVDHLFDWADRRMLDGMEAHQDDRLRVRDRVALALRLRLKALMPHREAVRRALSFLSLPGNGGVGLAAAYRTVNAVWYAAGDASTDFNFYTKRALLVPLHVAVVLYWLADESEDGADTWSFLDRRLDTLLGLPRLGARIREMMRDPLQRWPFRRWPTDAPVTPVAPRSSRP